jgi:hypothetical protein
LHHETYDQYEPVWSYSYQFKTATKLWRVKPTTEAVGGFDRMLRREADYTPPTN